MSDAMTTREKPPTVSAHRFHRGRAGLGTTVLPERRSVVLTAENSELATGADLVAADRPESVSRFRRCRSARTSAAP